MNDASRDDASAALTALLTRFRDRLRAIVLQRCPRALGITPDEVEQEVRIRLWQALQRERELTHPASYLHKTVLSVVVDLVRRRSARPDLSAAEELSQAMPPEAVSADPAEGASREAFTRAVMAAVAALPERRRRPVQLHLQGFTTAQVGQLLGMSEAAARNLVYRGLETLREHLREAGWDHE